MHRGFQLSLLATGQGKGYLFGAGVLEKYLEQHKTTPVPNEEDRAKAVADWLAALSATTASEATLEQKFVSEVMGAVLGYTPYPAPAGALATIYPKPGSKVTGIKRTPDAALGEFSGSDHRFTAVLELKTPGAGLDVPRPGYDYETPVEQAFHYGNRILGVRWVVVSDMRLIRLYSIEAEDEYEEIDLSDCVDRSGKPTAAFRRLFFLLHHDYLVKDRQRSQVSMLYRKAAERQIQIRDAFYEAYYATYFQTGRRGRFQLTRLTEMRRVRYPGWRAVCATDAALLPTSSHPAPAAPAPAAPSAKAAAGRLHHRPALVEVAHQHDDRPAGLARELRGVLQRAGDVGYRDKDHSEHDNMPVRGWQFRGPLCPHCTRIGPGRQPLHRRTGADRMPGGNSTCSPPT